VPSPEPSIRGLNVTVGISLKLWGLTSLRAFLSVHFAQNLWGNIMAQSKATISNKQFITMSVNLLHKAFIEPTRTQSKNLFKSLLEGERKPITTVKMEDGALVRFDIALDVTEFHGHLNYSSFRDNLMGLLASFVEAMKDGKEPPVFRAEGEEHKMLFGVTAPFVSEKQLNVMGLSAETSLRTADVLLKVVYLPPKQFIQEQQPQGVLGA